MKREWNEGAGSERELSREKFGFFCLYGLVDLHFFFNQVFGADNPP